MTRALLTTALALSLTLPVRAQEPAPVAPSTPPPPVDLSIPEWRLLTPPGGAGQLACFDQAGVQQILRIQEQARYALRLTNLQLTLETRMQDLIGELEAAQTEYAALRAVITERNSHLSEEMLSAQAETERYRLRIERRRIWPWVALGFGLIGGTFLGVEASR